MHDAPPELSGLGSDHAALAWWLEAERLDVDAIASRLAERGSSLTATDVDHLARNPLFRAKARAEVRRYLATLAEAAVERARHEIAMATPDLVRELVTIGRRGTREDAVRVKAITSALDRVPGLARIGRVPGTRVVSLITTEVRQRALVIAAEDDMLHTPGTVVTLDQAIDQARAIRSLDDDR